MPTFYEVASQQVRRDLAVAMGLSVEAPGVSASANSTASHNAQTAPVAAPQSNNALPPPLMKQDFGAPASPVPVPTVDATPLASAAGFDSGAAALADSPSPNERIALQIRKE